MTTPAFVPQSTSTLTAVRYHTALDPYHYTIDNRPLSDLATNLGELGAQGIDAARRASLISSMASNLAFESIFSMEDTYQFHGLVPSFASNVLTIGRGAVATVAFPYVGATTSTLRQGILAVPATFSVTAPGTAGQSINYLVQVKLTDLTVSVSSTVPYFDSANTYIPSSTTVAELSIGIKAGTAATTGSQVTPTEDAGWIPLYKVTSTNGVTSPVFETIYTGPSPVRKLRYLVTYADSASGTPASSTSINGMTVPRFLNAETSNICFSVPVKDLSVCPTAPLRLRLSMSSTAAGGNARFQLIGLALGQNSSTSTSPFTVSETFTMNATANTVSVFNSSATFLDASIKVPPSAFAELVSGVWKLSKSLMIFQLVRLGTDVLDTSTGSVDLLSVEVIQ